MPEKFILTNSSGPNEMLQSLAFLSGSTLFVDEQVYPLPENKEISKYKRK